MFVVVADPRSRSAAYARNIRRTGGRVAACVVGIRRPGPRGRTATSSPEYCKDTVVCNAQQCWGFTTDTARLAGACPVTG